MTTTTRRVALLPPALVAAFGAIAVAAGAAVGPLQASFDATPTSPHPGDVVALHSTTTGGSEATPKQYAWDLDDDGAFDDATTVDTTVTFPAEGNHRVRLRVRQPSTAATLESIAERTIAVTAPPADPPPTDPDPPPTQTTPPTETTPQTDPAPAPPSGNQPPVARYDRRCVKKGTFLLCGGLSVYEAKLATLDGGLSTDADGQVVRYEWDLNGDGTFETDGGTSPKTTHRFELSSMLIGDPGKRHVSLRVTDDKGATDVDSFDLRVHERTCQETATFRGVTVRSACLKARNRVAGGKKITRYTTTQDAVVNGIAVATNGRALTFDVPRDGSGAIPHIRTTGVASMLVDGAVATLQTGEINWSIPRFELRGFKLAKNASLAGLPITAPSGARPHLAFGRTDFDVYAGLTKDFGAPTSTQKIHLHAGGAQAAASTPLSFGVAHADLGPIPLDELLVTFDGEDLWEIKATVGLPQPSPIKISGDAGVRSNGDFDHLGASADFGPGIEIGGPVPVFLKRISFRVEVKPKQSKCVPHQGMVRTPGWQPFLERYGIPEYTDFGIPTFALCGEVDFTGGPTLLGAAAMRLTGGLGFATYDDRPWVMRAYGKARIVEIPVAEASAAVYGDGYIRLGGRQRWGIEDVFHIEGGFDLEMMGKKFNAVAWGEACIDFVDLCRGYKGIISGKGVAVCLNIDLLLTDWTPGIGYVWGESFPDIILDGCDVGDYKQHIKAHTRQAGGARGPQTLDLPAGLPGAVVQAKGQDGPPQVTLVTPDGRRIETPADNKAVQRDGYLLMKDPRSKTTQIAIGKPAAGRYTVELQENSTPLVSLKSAEGLDKPDVKASVAGKGRERILSYALTPRDGQKVTFVERGPSAGGEIGTAKGAKGTLRFAPADGKAESREIVAIVEQDGMARDEVKVASYRAPKSSRPAKVRGFTSRHRGSRLALRWTKQVAAARYQVRLTTTDGRTRVFSTTRNRLDVKKVARSTTGSVRVRAVSASGVLGTLASTRVRSAR